MEKDVAVKEWCIEKAIQMNHGLGNAGNVLSIAQILEDYLNGKLEIRPASFDGIKIKWPPKPK